MSPSKQKKMWLFKNKYVPVYIYFQLGPEARGPGQGQPRPPQSMGWRNVMGPDFTSVIEVFPQWTLRATTVSQGQSLRGQWLLPYPQPGTDERSSLCCCLSGDALAPPSNFLSLPVPRIWSTPAQPRPLPWSQNPALCYNIRSRYLLTCQLGHEDYSKRAAVLLALEHRSHKLK